MREALFPYTKAILTILLLILAFPSPALAFELSTFDPIGQRLQLLSETFPGLEAKGYLHNKTDLALHGPSDGRDGRRRRRQDFQMIEWNAELELRYRLSDHLELVNLDHFLYDALYDWDRGADLPKSVEREQRFYPSYKRILRELYLNANYGDWFLQLGKQQVVWGKMDGKVIDIINPEDLRESVNKDQDDFEFRRIPVWMANVTYFWSDYFLQFIWIPDFEPSVGPEAGSAWWYPDLPASLPPGVKVSKADKPSAAFKNHEWALQFNMVKRGWDISFIYFYTWSDRPTYFFRGEAPDKKAPTEKLLLFEPKHTRLHQFGGNVDKNFTFLGRDWAWRVEGLYTLNNYQTIQNDKGVAKRNNLLVFSSFETSWWNGEVFTFFQPMWRHQFGYDGRMRLVEEDKLNRSEISFILSLEKKWLDDRLTLTSTFYYDPKEGSWLFQDTVKWIFSNYLSAQLRYTGFSGSPHDLIGMYDEWDNLGFEVKYVF